MKRQPTKSFPILLLLLFFIASSCERADDHEGHSHEGKLVFETVNLDQIPQFEKKFRSDSAIYKSKIPFNKSGNDTITYFDLIVPENINSQLYDEAANLHYYTFALNLKEHNRLTNLVVKETLEGNKYYVFIFKSKSIDAWIQSLAHYGSDVNFNIETEILEIELGDSYTVKSTTRPCWTSATSWICPYNAHTIGVGDWLECSTFNEGGDGLSRWRSIVNYIQVPCDNGAGGTGGSGSGGSGSGSGGSSGGGGGGGSSPGSPTTPITVQPNAPSQLFLFASNLSPEQKTWWANTANTTKKIAFMSYLTQNNHSDESEDFARWAIYYFITNPTTTMEQIQNWFMKPNEGKDGPYDATFWENPNLTLSQQSLPSMQNFLYAFPKIQNGNVISNMRSPQVYQLVGGSILQNHQSTNPIVRANYQNACSVRGSRALNYAGASIPVVLQNGVQKTEKGGDNENYILSAKAFNKYMNKTFGPPTYRLTFADIARDLDNIANFLQGKNGIYTIINRSPGLAGYSGHIDIIINGQCLGGANANPKGGVEYIEIWELN